MNDPVMSPERLQRLSDALAARTPEQGKALDALAARVAQELQRDVALVSLVLDDAQWFVGAHGLDGWLGEVRGTPIEWSFCAQVVRSGEVLSVPDARRDPRFASNPLVTTGAVGSYHGVPLGVEGEVLGSLCVLGAPGAHLSSSGLERLREAAREAIALLGFA